MARTKLRRFGFFEHEADVGIFGVGSSLDEAFQEGAKALFQVMADIKNIEPKEEISIKAEAPDEEALFVEWLNVLLAEKDLEDMFFSDFEVRIQQERNVFVLAGVAKGEKTNPQKHHLKIEVKAATYSQLKVERLGNGCRVQCVVDV
ncbi:MAG: archease [Candidatus Thorarchaeota archaeon]|jgi:SHS2 domain-containing protein